MINMFVAFTIWLIVAWIVFLIMTFKQRRELLQTHQTIEDRLDSLIWETTRMPNGEYVRRKKETWQQ